MGCRRRVIIWMPQGGHLGIGITWRFNSGLTSSRVRERREAHRHAPPDPRPAAGRYRRGAAKTTSLHFKFVISSEIFT
ncbi:hypothetical protein EVAR_38731_1 [Eumeta japonica]|uniref:Uncharacterized protein n=1 Tax=Eumeta variegata TaxID=151549 RepID=A0A4C1YQG8_EUMVA|nr:hypothetical protein EVAR_38731_1 [Eumeta japonica]